MNQPPKRDVLCSELDRERSIRRAAKLLQAKRARIRDDLDCLVSHLALLMPQTATAGDANSELLLEAARRLNDDIFKELLTQVIEERK
ncbi:hypothetical protein [Myxosarcina sp. GI1]|uniref:hypothetical protein n=1 Tax=Myxosarcina sp. GI1 TaxID=1541065 RepID=UPI000569FCCE|nr:hypothetical protein [Myxosarcina sp. GI1]